MILRLCQELMGLRLAGLSHPANSECVWCVWDYY